jgi:hypothetical protein
MLGSPIEFRIAHLGEKGKFSKRGGWQQNRCITV